MGHVPFFLTFHPMNYLFEPIGLSAWQWVAFIGAGLLAGVINTLAGSGSLITLPLLMFVGGLPAPVANATNRVGIVIQGLVGLYGWNKAGKVPWQGSLWVLAPTLLGAVGGASLAVDISEVTMKQFIGGLLVVMFFLLILKPERWLKQARPHPERGRHPGLLLAYFALGVYGGFLQAGVGLLFLAVLVQLAGYDLTRANGLKLLVVSLLNIPAFCIFLFNGQIHLGQGLILAAAQSAGAWIAVRWVANRPGADQWMYRILVAVVAVSAAKTIYDLTTG